MQAWGVLEHREGNLDRAREMFQQGVWAQPKGRDVATVWQVGVAPNLLFMHEPLVLALLLTRALSKGGHRPGPGI